MRRAAQRLLAVAVIVIGLIPVLVHAQGPDPAYLDAKRLFDALDYDNAVRALDQAIALLQGRPAQDPQRRSLLASAYEMRARSKFGIGDQTGAQADFVALRRRQPDAS